VGAQRTAPSYVRTSGAVARTGSSPCSRRIWRASTPSSAGRVGSRGLVPRHVTSGCRRRRTKRAIRVSLSQSQRKSPELTRSQARASPGSAGPKTSATPSRHSHSSSSTHARATGTNASKGPSAQTNAALMSPHASPESSSSAVAAPTRRPAHRVVGGRPHHAFSACAPRPRRRTERSRRHAAWRLAEHRARTRAAAPSPRRARNRCDVRRREEPSTRPRDSLRGGPTRRPPRARCTAAVSSTGGRGVVTVAGGDPPHAETTSATTSDLIHPECPSRGSVAPLRARLTSSRV